MRRFVHAFLPSLLAALVLAPPPASAHPTDTFAACVKTPNGCETIGTFLYGDTVILKGVVSPVHDEAVVLRKDPGDDSWHREATMPISDTGRMKWKWATTVDDAEFDAYLLRFKIPGHGASNRVQAFVLSGE